VGARPPADMPATILGKPVVTDDNMPALGAGAFPVAFGNFQRGYLIADRFGIRVLRDPYTNKPFVQFYTTKRVGGGVVNFEAIKLLKCST
jgi:HK97 family phage major capsid protein